MSYFVTLGYPFSWRVFFLKEVKGGTQCTWHWWGWKKIPYLEMWYKSKVIISDENLTALWGQPRLLHPVLPTTGGKQGCRGEGHGCSGWRWAMRRLLASHEARYSPSWSGPTLASLRIRVRGTVMVRVRPSWYPAWRRCPYLKSQSPTKAWLLTDFNLRSMRPSTVFSSLSYIWPVALQLMPRSCSIKIY